MLAAMGLLFDSFWRAAAYCLRPRVIALSLLPLVLMALLAMGLGYFYWDVAVQAMRTLLDASSLLASVWGWLQGWGLGDVTAVMAPLLVVLAVAPVLVVVSLLAALFTVLGLNLAGLFEFGNLLPSSIASAQARNPMLDSFLSGVLAVAIASPCTAPFMGASLGFAIDMPAAQALTVFAKELMELVEEEGKSEK